MNADSPYQCLREMECEERGIYLARLMSLCAKYIELGSIPNAGTGLKKIAALASPDGDALQRVATYVNEGLGYRLIKNSRGVSEALRLTNHLSTSEEQYVRKLFFELCPFLKFAYIITNQAIAEEMKGEPVVHIIDLNASDPAQWIDLMHTWKRQRNPPLLRMLKLTGIHANEDVLDQTSLQLRREAHRLNFPLCFYPIVSKLDNLCLETLPVTKGEPLAISSVLQLHYLLATDDPMVGSRISPAASKDQRISAESLEIRIKPSPDSALSPLSQCASPKMECFLNGLWKLQPRLMVITEQESNVNGLTLMDRLDNALNFYGALFDCLQSTVEKTRSVERIILERMLLGEEIKNIIACEGVERKERHEKVETWIPWLELAGFRRVPINHDRMLEATRPLQSYGRGYKLLEHNQCLFIFWNDRPLYSMSTWRF